MKKLLLLLALCVSFVAISQEMKRENINGKIIVEGNDLLGITVYNSLSKQGAVTNEKGEFVIAAKLNDPIEIRALEYQNLTIVINESMLESKSFTVFMIEEINKLEEIIIKTKKFSGNLKVDVDIAKKFIPKPNTVYFGIKNKESNQFNDTNTVLNKNLGTDSQVQTHVNGLNVVNIVDQLLIPLFRSEVKDKKAVGVPEVPSKSIKYYLGSNFLVENFNIPEHRVEEFIRYVEDEEAFDFDLLNYGNELKFLDLISKKSQLFLEKKKK
jgi:hypothetical protein